VRGSTDPTMGPILQSDRRIDLVMSDVVLPHINGRKLAEIARASPPDLKVLFVTGYAENATVRGDFLDPGMDILQTVREREKPG
jgi:CheY-like chemotaxis protein